MNTPDFTSTTIADSLNILEKIARKPFHPVSRSAIQAFLEAVKAPGSLIKVTCKVDDVSEFLYQVLGCDPDFTHIDHRGSVDQKSKPGPPVLEFKNGSGIEIVLAPKG